MRPFEIIIPVLLLAYLIWRHPRPLAVRLLPAVGLIVTLLHFAVEGYRWQMVPLYVLNPLLAISSLVRIMGSSDWKPLASRLTVIPVLLAAALPALLPVPRIPPPGGPLPVGTSVFELTDPSRRELYSGRDEARRFMIQVWYPAQAGTDDEQAPWMENAEIFAPAIAAHIDMPPYFLDHLALVKIPAYKDAAPAASAAPFPVILFSHGWNGFNAQSAGQALELASRGFVVVGVQHTYGAVVTVFPDGTVAKNNPEALPEGADDPEYEAAARMLANQWAGDMSFVLDQFQSQTDEAGDFFKGKLDLERVGVYGHSTGGGAAIQFCGTHPRCKAVLGMDPFMRPVSAKVLENGLTQPAFFMFSQSWADLTDSRNNQLFRAFYSNAKGGLGAVRIEGTKHYDFSDLPLLSPIAPMLGLKGPLNGTRVTEIVNAYLVDFFELTLNGKPSALFDGGFDDFEEVKVNP
jgi:predicted dienelactone hydrolase